MGNCGCGGLVVTVVVVKAVDEDGDEGCEVVVAAAADVSVPWDGAVKCLEGIRYEMARGIGEWWH